MISVAASSLPVGLSLDDGPADVQAADGGGGEIFGAERADHLVGVGGEGSLVAGKFDEQVGTVTPGAQRTKSALELSPDQVDSHASRVVSWPKLIRP